MWSLIWNQGFVNPMTNALLLFYDFLGNNFFLALAAFTLVTRLIMLPLNLRQQRSMMKTQEMNPQIQAIQRKYRDNPQKMQEEFRRIGYNPAESLSGCLLTLVQFPIFIGLYQAIQYVLASTPQGLYQLSQRVYDFVDVTPLLPVGNKFLWLNLAQPDPILVLPILVVGSMYLSQKLMTPAPPPAKKGQEEDPTQAAMRSMQYTMPMMFGLFSLQFPAGVSIYFIFSSLIGMLQSFVVKRERDAARPAAAATSPVIIDEETAAVADEKPALKVVAPRSNAASSAGRRNSKRKRQSSKP